MAPGPPDATATWRPQAGLISGPTGVIGPSRPDPLGVTYDDEDGWHTIIRAAIDVGARFSPDWATPPCSRHITRMHIT